MTYEADFHEEGYVEGDKHEVVRDLLHKLSKEINATIGKMGSDESVTGIPCGV